MIKKAKLLKVVHFFDPSDPISVFELLTNFNVACKTNRIYEDAAMLVLPFFVKNAFKTEPTTWMFTALQIAPLAALANAAKPLILKKLFR